MLFNSLSFLAFFPIVTIGYYCLAHRYRWAWLLAASCYFYMALIPIYILILLFTILIDYVSGILIEESEGRRRKIYLILSIVSNVTILGFFKYYNFFIDSINHAGGFMGLQSNIPLLNIILPVGLSFHTFQAMSYTIDVYWRAQKAERHLGYYALYVMFYPQLVAGPIERPMNLLPQFHAFHKFDLDRIGAGMRRMLVGLFKKVVIADGLAQIVDPIYTHPEHYSGATLGFATLLFGFQIYADFSGYTDIALGAAQAMGIKLMENFRRPYLSKSVSEFWSRWHISLSSWFRDYVFTQLISHSKKQSWLRWQVFLVLTFALSGLWHGANWNFVLWGVLNGLYIATEYAIGEGTSRIGVLNRFFARVQERRSTRYLKNIINIATTFTLITCSWILFRANGFEQSVLVAEKIFRELPQGSFGLVVQELVGAQIAYDDIYFAIWLICGVAACEIFRELFGDFKFTTHYDKLPLSFRWAGYYSVGIAILFWGVFKSQQFIYFQF